jgi:hypothetical protein
MTQGENLSLQVSTYSERTSERPQQRKQDGHHRFGRLHGRARKFKGIKADRVFGRDRAVRTSPVIQSSRHEGTMRPTVVLFLWWRSRIFVYRKVALPPAAPRDYDGGLLGDCSKLLRFRNIGVSALREGFSATEWRYARSTQNK